MATADKKKPQGEDENTQPDPTTKELVDPKTGEVTEVADDEFAGYTEDAGAGFENQTAEDVSIPTIDILQPTSPQVMVEDTPLKAGMLYISTTGAGIKGSEGVTFIPALTRHSLPEFIPRDKGGGFVFDHDIDSELARRVRAEQGLGKYKHPDNENELKETYTAYGVALDGDGNPFPAVWRFSSTHIKPYKDWMFRARSIVVVNPTTKQKITKLPLFSHAYNIRTQKMEKNGNTWYIPVINFADESADKSRLPANSELYQLAKSVREAVSAGKLKEDTSTLRNVNDADGDALRKGDPNAEKAPY